MTSPTSDNQPSDATERQLMEFHHGDQRFFPPTGHATADLELRTTRVTAELSSDGRLELGRRVESLHYRPMPRTPELPMLRPGFGLVAPTLRAIERIGGHDIAPYLWAWDRVPFVAWPTWEAAGVVDPHLMNFLEFGAASREFGETIFRRDRALPNRLIRYDAAQVDPARIIAQTVRAWPAARVAVITATRPRAREIGRRLRRWTSDVRVGIARHREHPDAQIVVGTPAMMAVPNWRVWRRQFVFVVDADRVRNGLFDSALCQADSTFRVVGLVDANQRLAPFAADELFGIYGADEITLPRHGHALRPVDVVWARHDTLLHDDPRGPMAQRRITWANRPRLTRIARLAAALAANDRMRVARFGCDLATARPAGGAPPTALVLADVLETAIAFAERLPDWRLVHRTDLAPDALTDRQRRVFMRQVAWTSAGGRKLIATTGSLDLVDMNTVDIVLWVGAGRHGPPLDHRRLAFPVRIHDSWQAIDPSTAPQGEPRLLAPLTPTPSLLLVDVADRGHPVARDQTRRRRAVYLEREWLPPGADRLAARVDRFLATRPETTP